MGAAPTDWVIPSRYWQWAGTATARLAVLWVLCAGCAGYRLHSSRHMFDTPSQEEFRTAADRTDGNSGHTHIDFGGQWVMGRMVVEGHARELYDRNRQRQVVQAGFPIADEPPEIRDHVFPTHLQPKLKAESPRHDSDALMEWFMGRDSPRWKEVGGAVATAFAADNPLSGVVFAQSANDQLSPDFSGVGVIFAHDVIAPNPFGSAALLIEGRRRLTLLADVNAKKVGGPLYPPIHGFVYAPLAAFRPATAYAIFQVLSVAMTFVAGLGVRVFSKGQIAWPAATLVIMLFPGYRPGLDLGQNQVFTLTVAIWGWALASRGRDGLGGMVWGLFAVKPVWGLAFVLVPLVMGRWKFCVAMAVTGCGLAAVTLPFTGVEVWKDWLAVGAEASETYKLNKNWIGLSRDLQGLPRRILTNFDIPEEQRRDNALAAQLGWALWGSVLFASAGVYLWRANPRNQTGLAVGFLFLGAYLCCYRFMYYDSLLAAVGVLILFANPTIAFRTWEFDLRGRGDSADPFGPKILGYVSSVSLTIVVLLLMCENWLYKFDPNATFALNGLASTTTDTAGTTARHVPQISGAVGYYYAWDTALVFVLWLWSGVRLAFGGDRGPGR